MKRTKRSTKIRIAVAVVLIVVGTAVAASPFVGNWLTYLRNKKMLEQFTQFENAFQSAQANASPTPTLEPGATPDPNAPPVQYDYQYLSFNDQTVIGVIQIDRIDIRIPIVEGVKDENLILAIGHYPGTGMPGAAGNVVLAGHRSYSFGQFFNRLDEMQIADPVLITYRGTVYRYIVYDIFEILPDESWVLTAPDNKNDKILTLITCTPVYGATHRLIVRCRLDERDEG
jgi:sortase A